MNTHHGACCEKKGEAASASSPFVVGRDVRCFFGDEFRDGRIEHIDARGLVHVRLSAGWLHTAEPGDLLSIPRGHLLRAGDEVHS